MSLKETLKIRGVEIVALGSVVVFAVVTAVNHSGFFKTWKDRQVEYSDFFFNYIGDVPNLPLNIRRQYSACVAEQYVKLAESLKCEVHSNIPVEDDARNCFTDNKVPSTVGTLIGMACIQQLPHTHVESPDTPL